MSATFTAVDPAGKTHKRSSKERVYTHTVVYREGEAFRDKRAAHIEATRISTEKSYTRLESNAAGNPEPGRHPSVWARDTAFAIEYLAKHPSRAVYVAEAVARAEKHHAEYVAGGFWDVYQNAGWCGRLELAEKLAASLRSCGYADIRILPAVAVAKVPA